MNSCSRIWAIVLIALMLACPLVAKEGISLKIEASQTHALLYMIECLLNQPHRSTKMGTVLRGRIGNWTPVALALDKWKKSLAGEELSKLRLPRIQGRSVNISGVLEKVALQSTNGQDLAQRTKPWLGPDHARALAHVIEILEPLYLSYYWSEAKPLIDRRKSELAQALAKGDFNKNYARAASFFRGSLPQGELPVLALVPYIPPIGTKKLSTRGHNAGALQVMEVRVDRPIKDEAGVVFHEFVHALWSGQAESEKTRWKNRFHSHGLVGRLAYAQLNEGLATAIGNGWFQSKVSGALDSGSWYSDPVIDTYGHALFPVVKQALNDGRPPTDEELDQMVAAFKKELPESVATFDVVASDFLTVSSLEEVNRAKFQQDLMRLGPVRWSRVREWGEASQVSATFRLYWLEPGQRKRLEGLGWAAQEIESWTKYRLRQTDLGWELAFQGTHKELFDLLRGLQEDGLRDSSQ